MVPSEESIRTNLRRGALEYCVLAILRGGQSYGFDIARTLGGDGVLMGGEGTLYPLLSRLRREGLVETTWQESSSGPPRRYYRMTPDGERALETFAHVWEPFRSAVDRSLSEGREPS